MKRLMLLIVLILLCGCTDKSNINLDKQIIEKLAIDYPLQTTDDGLFLPSRYSSIDLYARCSEKQVTVISLTGLMRLYDQSNKSVTFYDFIEEILTQRRLLEESEETSCFDLVDSVTEEYERLKFEEFVDLYFVEIISGNFTLKKDVDSDKIDTIAYYCFINNYSVSFDCYIGLYYLVKISEII